jgi:hypothetical protein
MNSIDIPANAPAWWSAIVLGTVAITQIFKVAFKSKPWWSAAKARTVAILVAVAGALAASSALPGAWWVDGLQGLMAGLLAILGYDGMAKTDTGVRRIGVLLLCAAFGVPMTGCSGFQASIEEPHYAVEDGPDEDAIPDTADFGLTVATNQGVNLKVTYVQGFLGLYPATLCLEVVNDDGIAFQRLCGSCEWAEGVSACEVVPPSPVESPPGG